MGTSEVFNSRIDHKNRTHNPLPPKTPLETIVTPTFANLEFRPPPFSSIFTIGNPIVNQVNQLLRVAIFMDLRAGAKMQIREHAVSQLFRVDF